MMEFRPNKKLINGFLMDNFHPKIIAWSSDYNITLNFDEKKLALIEFDKSTFKAISTNYHLNPIDIYEKSKEIIDALNGYRKNVGTDYVDDFDEKAYKYLKSCVEGIDEKDELTEFLDRHGEDIQKILPEFSANQKDWEHWETGEKDEKCYVSEAYTLIFRSTEVELNDADGFYLTTFDWSEDE